VACGSEVACGSVYRCTTMVFPLSEMPRFPQSTSRPFDGMSNAVSLVASGEKEFDGLSCFSLVF